MDEHALIWLLICCVCGAYSFTCRDSANNSVDWFIVYKLPVLPSHPVDRIRHGIGFYYMDSKQNQWRLSNTEITSQSHAIAHTFNAVQRYSFRTTVLHASYNDEYRNIESRAHAKGLLAFDSNEGFWLIHSVPKWPTTLRAPYEYPSNGIKSGQTFICVAFQSKYIDVIGQQLNYMWPDLYDVNMPESFRTMYPKMSSVLIDDKHVKTAPYNNSAELVSSNGKRFVHLAKSSKWHKDLYSDWLSYFLGSDLYVESWRDGRGNFPSVCNSSLTVENCVRLEWPQKVSDTAVVVCTKKDHSKWAIAPSSPQHFVCIGDVNRQAGQLHRGGGTLCVGDPGIWSAFYSLVTWVDYCKPQPKPPPTDCT